MGLFVNRYRPNAPTIQFPWIDDEGTIAARCAQPNKIPFLLVQPHRNFGMPGHRESSSRLIRAHCRAAFDVIPLEHEAKAMNSVTDTSLPNFIVNAFALLFAGIGQAGTLVHHVGACKQVPTAEALRLESIKGNAHGADEILTIA